ncbi:amino acid adenylation domain-containing protein [Pseudomonas xanthosomatis]|uniref:non-ribosomal peptide synthetase n=1 Tax=Pseudomonas xanthosomatis TaxID=2842356 RepID=UPI001C3D54C2|nr:non-ribosomal peptide synthetase [Pseudomonas xanthosomatis]QXH44123.1 amino acid adenylation domain-containing protein [Pseudomonas xanthosomatis]
MDNQSTAARIARRFVLMPLEKRRLYLEKMAEENLSPANLPVPECQSALQVLPLSFAQERLWFIWQLEPDSAAYNLPRALRLRGALDLAALGRAFDALVARHQPLRTLFGLHEGKACQLIQAPFSVDISVETLSPGEAQASLQARIEEQVHQPFDLQAGPLFRVHLLRLAADDHVLVLTLHHIVSDGWSMQVMVDELVQGYLACTTASQGEAPAALPIQYADYAIWQRAWMQAGEQDRQLAYWAEELGDEQPALQLPADHLRPTAPSGRGDSVELLLPAALSQALQGVAQQHGATLFMLLLASLQALLHRYSGQQDIRIGVPTANRNRPEIEGLIGFFVNTQVIRAQLDGRTRFEALLQQVKDRTIRAQAYQDLPFEQVVERLSPERSLSHSPLFQVMFNHQRETAAQGLVQLPGLQIEGVQWRNHTAKLDLALDTREAADGSLSARFTYSLDLFEHATIERLARHWQQLLGAIAADPGCALGELALLDEQERREALRAWQQPAASEHFTPVHQAISAHARRTPDAVAIICQHRSLSFAELDARSDRLAASLWRRTEGRAVRIGIALPRDEQVFVALLAVLKAGCAYVPLDLKHPPQRLAYLMRDAGMPLLLTHSSVSAGLPEAGEVLALDIEALLAEPEAPAPALQVHPAQLAYVIYTSGSTGEPKGVEVAHAGIARHCQAIGERYGMTPEDCELLFMSLAFDGAHERWLTTLTHGGRLLLREDSLWTPEQTLQAMVEHQVSVAAFPPVYLQQLTEQAALEGPLPKARIYCFGGDAVPKASFERLREVLRPDYIINGYGPTETVVTPLLWKAPANQPCPSAYAPIGSPVGPRTACVLDASGNLMPAGACGELYLGGLLAQGYLGRPGLTAERFVPDPFGNGERLYRTGDLVRQRADGEYDYLGRVDQQVKIRGFRIELGEIESRLLAHAGVEDAAVQAREGQGGKQLVAYVVAAADLDGQALLSQLRANLRVSLPDYMVPAHFMLLPSLPLNPNGKLDRKALPAPVFDACGADHVAPEAGLEARIAGLWQDILGHGAVSATANFFELGGDSIIAIQVVGRARQAGIHFTPKDMFIHQTVRELAQVAQLAGGQGVVEQGPEQGTAPLLPIAEWFFTQDHPLPGHWNQAVALEPRQALQPQHLRQALEALIAHHDSLRMHFTRDDAGVQARYLDSVDASQVLWHEQLDDLAQWPALAEKAQRSLDLQHGPLLRVVLADLPEQRQGLLLVIHHLVVDGVSWRILLEDLQTLLGALNQGQPLRLPARSSSVKAWAQQLQAAATQPRWLAQLDYWAGLAEGAVAALPVRAGASDTARNQDARQLDVTLDEADTARLLHQAPAAYRTQINDLLLAALALAVRGWTGHAHTLVQLEGHGRESDSFEGIDLTRSVGWFTNAYPLRLTAGEGVGQTLRLVKEQLRAVPDKGLGFGLLRYLGDAASRARLAALAQPRITFNYLGQVDGGFNEPGGLFGPGSLVTGSSQDAQAPLGNWLTINGKVEAGRLSLAWKFSDSQFGADDMAALANDYLVQLRALIEHCCDPAQGSLTPSDFPLLALEQAQLDQLPVAARQVQDLYPLSPMQQGMLFHSLYQQGSSDYINQLRSDVEGLDPERFAQAWQQAMDRHDILRSAFLWAGAFEQPVQLVHRQLPFPLQVLDWSDRPVDAAALDALAEAQRQAGFELAQAPLLRMVLVRLAGDRHHLIYTNHHVLMDGWSSSQLLGEVLQAYAGQAMAPVRGRYRDYIAWLQRQDAQASQRFWQAQLAPLPAPTLLANGFAVRQGGSVARQQAECQLDAQACERLNQFARRCKVTLNTVVQGAWGLLLQRWSGQDVVAFGATVAGRPAELAGIEQQVGLFINTLPVVVQAAPQQPLDTWLQALQAQNLAIREHEHCALADIQRCAGFEPQSLFDSLLVFENYPVAEALSGAAPSGVRFSTIDSREQTHLPFTLTVHQGSVLALGLTCTGPLEPGLGQRLLEQLAQLLGHMSQAGGERLGNLPMLADADYQQLVHGWNATEVDYPNAQPVHRLFEAQVRATPQALALVCAGRELDYASLNAQANRLAHQLIAHGVGPESRVAVVAERSVEMVVALLAVLKAGGAYVPIDPELPAERIAYLLRDSAAQLLLGQAALRGQIPADDATPGLWLEADAVIAAGFAQDDPQVVLQPQNLAYVIYTSGSTGQPKGAGNSHAALYNRLAWMQQAYALGEGDRVLQKTPFSFDVSVWEFFWPLMVGVPLVMALPGEHRDPALLVERIVAQGVTTLHFVPSMLQAFLQDPQVARCTGLRRIVCSGEALPVEAQRQVFERLPQAALYNLYGPTEAAIDVTHWTCREEGSDSVPIGQPIANLATYVLDAALRPLPAGVVGELYLGGLGLARGYHQRPALTAERFVPSPFATAERLYRTGDLARQRADGVIEYAGRIDHQVKIRGLRIELGEIEARLLEQAWVSEAVVVARDGSHGKRLVAYLVATSDAPQGPALVEAVATQLRLALPEYMVPSHFEVLASMPLSANGKLDRKALPEPGLTQAPSRTPQGEHELALAQIWQELLGLEQVGADDNFFALGGDSIISIQVVNRARQRGLAIQAKDIFEQQTIALLALKVGSTGNLPALATPKDWHGLSDAEVQALALPHARITGLYSLSPMQKGMLFLGLDSPDAQLYVNQLSLPVHGLDPARLRKAWAQVVQRHDILRTGFLWQGLGDPLQFVLDSLELAYSELDWRDRPHDPQALRELAREERERGFDLANPPLQRLMLVSLDNGGHQLIWTYHHMLIDGWSTSQLVGEVLALYAGKALPEPVPYRQYIGWLRNQDEAQGEVFWREQLEPLNEPTLLAAWQPHKASGHGHQALYSRLDAQLTARLKAFAQQQRITFNTLVQGAWLLLLSRYSGQSTVAFGATVAGRPANLAHSDSILGLFINTLPVVHSVQPTQAVGDWLRELQARNLAMRDFEFTPLAQIQRWAGRPGQALFDSIIVFENHPVDQTLRDWSDEQLRFGEMDSVGLTNLPMDLMVTLDDVLVIEYMFLRQHFDVQAVEGIRQAMEGLLLALAEDAGRALGVIGLPCPAPQPAAVPVGASQGWLAVHQRIAQWAERTPGALALTCADGATLTHGELQQRANRLAHWLVGQGVGPEVRVAVALPRNEHLLVALLAVLKAGGAYVPLDVDYPRDRLAWQMQDSGAAMLLTDAQQRELLPIPQGVMAVDLPGLVLDGLPEHAPACEVAPGNLAYIIYTSGSTGLPKGVAVSHGPLAMHCLAVGELYQMSPADCELHFMSFAFDGAHERWLTALSHGARLLLRGDGLWTAPQTLEQMRRHRVSVAAFPPVYLQQLAEQAELEGDAPAVRVYCFGGDAVPKASFERVRAALAPQWIINGYGPTETVVTPLIWRADAQQACDSAYAPIGAIVGQRSAYVLDADLNPLPAGLAGELYLGGEGLARGYLERPGLSAERFVADPFGASGQRLYRTGDLVRERADGGYDYLGRLDQQVKVRGFRIELGEVEACLKRCAGVRDAVVVAHASVSGQRLAGYVVMQQTPACADPRPALNLALEQALPDYMRPSSLTVLDALPLTPNGKIDRRNLPEPGVEQRRYVAPRSELQIALAAIWSEVLKVEQVGMTDNFYELGGDSILSLQVVAKARGLARLGLRLKLRDLVSRPTIAELTGEAPQGPALAPTLPLNAALGGQPPLFCLHAGFGTVFDYEPLARRLNGVRPLVGLPCRMLLEPGREETSLEAMALDYAQAIRGQQAEGPYHLLGWSLGATLAALVAAELERQGQRVAFLGLADSFVPGTEQADPDRPGDWHDDLQSLMGWMSAQAPKVDPAREACEATARHYLGQAMAQLGQQGGAYAALGLEEWLNLFATARRLKRLALGAADCQPLRCSPRHWWVEGRQAHRQALAGQLGQPLDDATILPCDHFQLPRNEAWLDAISDELSPQPVALAAD